MVRVGYGFTALCCLLFYTDSGLLLSWLIAAAAHEGGHVLAARLCGIRLEGMRLGLGGASLELGSTERLSYTREFICALAGPAASFALALALAFAAKAPGLDRAYLPAGISFCLGAFNLLPAKPLDGGRALHCLLLSLLESSAADRISTALGGLTALVITASGVYSARFSLSGVWLILLGGWLLYSNFPLPKRLKRYKIHRKNPEADLWTSVF